MERVSRIFIEAVPFLQCKVVASDYKWCYTCKGLEAWDWGIYYRPRHNVTGLIESCVYLLRMVPPTPGGAGVLRSIQ